MLSFLCCWYIVEKKYTKEERDFFTSLLSFLNPKISFLLEKEGGVCAERDVTHKVSREQT